MKSDLFCWLALCLLPLFAYLPAATLSLSLNPMNFGSGLISARHRGVTQGGPWLDPNASFTVQALGGLSAQSWLHGIVPWWNRYTGAGLPLAAEMQTVSLFLPFVLLLHFTNGVIYLKITLQIVAGWGTYALLRQLRLGRLAAFAGAALYGFNGPFAWFAHGPIMPIAFLPFVLLGVERAFTRAEEGKPGGWALLSVALAYSLYAGFPETAFLDGLLVLAWALYRVAVTRPAARLAFATKVMIGGLGGLLLAAPILLPFLEYQRLSQIAHTFPTDGLPKISLAPLFLPYIFGPIGAFNDADPTHRLGDFWGANGGYLNLTVLFVAVLGLFTGRTSRGLRILLGVWLAVILGRLMNVFFLGYLVNLVPLFKFVAVDRYSEPSWAMASAVLAAYALDDWRRSAGGRFAAILVSGITSLVLGSTAVWLASSIIGELLHNLHGQHYPLWLWGSLGWALLFTTAIALLYSRRPSARSALVLGVLVTTNALGLYVVPTLAGVRRSDIDFGLVAFLQRHLGLERFYTLGPFSPNYGAYFQVASINHNAVPVPADWIQYIDSTLDPNSVIQDPSLFVGYFPGPFSDREEALRANLPGFEATAVKYVLVQPGTNPFISSVAVPTSGGSKKPLLIHPGETVSGTLPKDVVRSGVLSSIGITLGMYGNPATGQFEVEICSGQSCSFGMKSLAETRDRQNFKIDLTPPLRVESGNTLRYTFRHIDKRGEPTDSDYFLFVWFCPSQTTGKEPITAQNGRSIDYTPELTLRYGMSTGQPQLVYHGQVADVFELPHPAEYLEVRGGPCKLSAEAREFVHASCKAAAVLIRREFSYPGWQAFVNSQETPIRAFPPIFQAVDLPSGESRVSFTYRPSHIDWAYACGAVGFLCLLAGAVPTLDLLRQRVRRLIVGI